MQPVRVRFAPSPTGPLHIGGLRTALYNYLLAKQQGGSFILRIEDTDQNRYVDGAEEYIQEALAWCGMTPDEGPQQGGPYAPYRQSERTSLYQQATQRLLDAGHAYYAFDSAERLDELRLEAEAIGTTFRYGASTRRSLDNSLGMGKSELEARLQQSSDYVVRLLVEPGEDIVFKDRVRGSVAFSSDELDDKVLMKADGHPTYHLANVVDDEHMRISHVIRGEEWLPSTAHHVLLYRAFGWEDKMPEFAHLPLLLKPEGKGKLSKRDGAKFGMPVFPLEWKDREANETLLGFRESGFLSEALVNFLALLGWNPGTEQEIFSLSQLIEAFDLDRIGKSGARFDFDKARWFNHQYIATLSNDEFSTMAASVMKDANLQDANGEAVELSPEFLASIAPLMRERLHMMTELPDLGSYFFVRPQKFDEEQLNKRLSQLDDEQLGVVASALNEVASWRSADIAASVKAASAAIGAKLGAVLPLYRIAMTGGMHGPDVFDLSEVLGREETLARWKRIKQI